MNGHRIPLATLVLLAAASGATAESVEYLGPDEESGASQAVVVEGHALVHTGQILPLDKQGALIGEGSVDTQLAHVIFNLETALAAGGSGTKHLVKLNLYVDSPRTAARVRRMFARRFPAPVRPAMSWVCTPLAHPKVLVSLDAVAIVPGDGPDAVVHTRCKALAGNDRVADVAILPRGQAVYVAGIPEKGDLAAATAKAMQGLIRTIGQVGLDHSQVVQIKAFLQSMDEADVVMQQVSKTFADQTVPPVVLVEWMNKTPIEIEMIAFSPAGPSASTPSDTVSYFTPPGVKASPVYSRVALVHGGKRIYIAGLHADKPGDGEAQVRSIFGQLDRIAKEAGTDLRHLVKATYYVADDDVSAMLNKLRPEYYDPKRPPAASKAMVKGVGMADRTLTLDMIGVAPRQ